ncbi:MAG TPA: prolyl oligopeptidase family serine peptidase [Terracidiphilus sp.]|nr:prolyl oligopeptidase family serine peptidase [Terracidiphilus sp.]
MRFPASLFAATLAVSFAPVLAAQAKPSITLDEYLNTTDITAARLSPDGSAAVIATEAPDWKNSVYSDNLWLWTASAGLQPLTHSGSEENPQWSPDGKWIAFASDRALPGQDANPDGDPANDGDKARRIWIILATGGEALPLYTENLDVHAFAWAPDSTALYFTATQPLTPEEKEAHETEWHDVIRWREQDRGDVILKLALAPALARAVATPLPDSASAVKAAKGKPDASTLPPGAVTLATSALAIQELVPSPDGSTLALLTGPIHYRTENPADFEIFTLPSAGGALTQITHNQALEAQLHWSPDGHALYFAVPAAAGSLEGPYRDVQGRIYRLEPVAPDAKPIRLGSSFTGSFDQFNVLPDGRILALGLTGTETQVYLVTGDSATKLPGRAGTYAGLESSLHAGAILVRHSTVNDPTQVYLAVDPLHPDQLKALTAFNPIFAQRAQPEYEPYTWKSDDGRTVEGELIYPPGKKGAKHLRMLTLIHGGPADADGNRFGADWYDWATFAADRGWLVFRPNYRGSTGYGDDFMLAIAPHLVSAPGRDILAGVDALVRDGHADPDHLAIGGYSYGGYMTNWLITQTTRFRSALTGAGAVEHAANWGNDDCTFDDAWYLGGRPWENPAMYESEAALFRFDKVKTPTHLAQGGSDIRVAYLEGVAMERALQSLGIPHTFLVFPGEGHSLEKNPWHGYIKLRDELAWLEKYDKQ